VKYPTGIQPVLDFKPIGERTAPFGYRDQAFETTKISARIPGNRGVHLDCERRGIVDEEEAAFGGTRPAT